MTKTNHIIMGAGVTALLLWSFTKSKAVFAPIVDFLKVRGDDPHGSGAFGASRGNELHHGLDIEALPGEAIKSPITGKVIRHSYPYPDKSFSGYHLLADKYLIKIWYLAPTLNAGDSVIKGQLIGYAQNIAARYPGITPHVHIEVWDRFQNNVAIDPSKLFNV